MDLEQNEIKKPKLILEARHSKSIEASNKIRSSLRPRLFIPRLPPKKSTKGANSVKAKVKNKFRNPITSEKIKNVLVNHHFLLEKDKNKMIDNILNLVRGKCTTNGSNCKSIEKNMSNKLPAKKNRPPGKDMEEKHKVNKNCGIEQEIDSLILTQNDLTLSEMEKKAVEKILLRSKKSFTIKEYNWKSKHEKIRKKKNSSHSPHQAELKQNPNKLSESSNSPHIEHIIPVLSKDTEKFKISDNKSDSCVRGKDLNDKEARNTPETKNSLKSGEFIKLENKSETTASPHNTTQLAEDYIKQEDFNVYWKEYCRNTLNINKNAQSSCFSSTYCLIDKGYSSNASCTVNENNLQTSQPSSTSCSMNKGNFQTSRSSSTSCSVDRNNIQTSHPSSISCSMNKGNFPANHSSSTSCSVDKNNIQTSHPSITSYSMNKDNFPASHSSSTSCSVDKNNIQTSHPSSTSCTINEVYFSANHSFSTSCTVHENNFQTSHPSITSCSMNKGNFQTSRSSSTSCSVDKDNFQTSQSSSTSCSYDKNNFQISHPSSTSCSVDKNNIQTSQPSSTSCSMNRGNFPPSHSSSTSCFIDKNNFQTSQPSSTSCSVDKNNIQTSQPSSTSCSMNRGNFPDSHSSSTSCFIDKNNFQTSQPSSTSCSVDKNNIQTSQPSGTSFSIGTHYSTDHGIVFIGKDLLLDTSQHQAKNGYDESFKSFYKNTTMVTELQNAVKDSISHLHNSSSFDLQINQNLINLENSVNDFSKYLLRASKDIEEMEEQIKQDLVYISKRDFKSLASNKRRFQQYIESPKTNSTDNNNSEDNITILIEADQMPTKAITFKKSEIKGSEINLPQEDISDRIQKKSDLIILSNIKLPNLILNTITNSKQQQQSQLGLDKTQASGFPHLQERYTRINLEAEQGMQDTQTNCSVANGRDTVFPQFLLNMPGFCQNYTNSWKATQPLEFAKKNANDLENFSQRQNLNRNSGKTFHNSIKELVAFCEKPQNNFAHGRNIESSSFQQHSNDANQVSTKKSSQTKRKVYSKGSEQNLVKRQKQEEPSKYTSNQKNTPLKQNTPALLNVRHYQIPPKYTQTQLSSNRLQNSLYGNLYPNMYQPHLTQSQEPQTEHSSFGLNQSFRNIYNEYHTPYNHFVSSPIFNNNPYVTTAMGLCHNPNLVPRSNVQFNTNSLESMNSQTFWNVTLPPFYNQTADYNFNAPTFLQSPFEDGRMRSNT